MGSIAACTTGDCDRVDMDAIVSPRRYALQKALTSTLAVWEGSYVRLTAH